MTSLALAVDLGGTKVEAALVDAQGLVVDGSRSRRPTGAGVTPDGLRAAIDDVARDALAAAPDGASIGGAGIGTAGPVDIVAGTIFPVNLPLVHGVDLRTAVAEASQLERVVLRHDGACIALGESWVGATVGARASMSIVVSTGVGGGFVIDGRSFTGASGNAGHLGQMRDGDATVEDTASGTGTVAWARSQGWSGATGEDLGRDAAAGDALARRAIERSAACVGRALADASTLVDLDVIAIGGGFSRVSPDYVELVAAAAATSAALPYSRVTRIVPSGLRDEGPLIGAAALVLR